MTKTTQKTIAVRGAGIAGLWCAFTLARRGHAVTLLERSTEPFADACSRYAGAMLAPYAEEEAAEPLIRELGLRGLELWRESFPGTWTGGSLVLAQPRDRRELDRFARLTEGHQTIDEEAIGSLEPDLAGRFVKGLHYPEEAHVVPEEALSFLLDAVRKAGAAVRFGVEDVDPRADFTLDCRGLAARDDLIDLRGVRGERIVIRTKEVSLQRAVRLLHPRFPLYVVPWRGGTHMVGATQIESEEEGNVTVRSALELLSTAYALHPAFGEAEIVSTGSAARPAFPDNRPRIVVRDAHVYINGLFRHGFLLAPVMAELAANFIESGAKHPEVFA